MKLENWILFRLIYKHRKASIRNQRQLYDRLLKCCGVDPSKVIGDRLESNFSCGISNIDADGILGISSISYEELSNRLENYVVRDLVEKERIALLKELLQLVHDDESIGMGVRIGYSTCPSKKELLEANKFCLSTLLAQLFKYCVNSYRPYTKRQTKIPDDFVERSAQYISSKGKEIIEIEYNDQGSTDIKNAYGFEDTFKNSFESTRLIPSDDWAWIKLRLLQPYIKRKNLIEIKSIQDLAESSIMQFIYSWRDLESISKYSNSEEKNRALTRASRKLLSYEMSNSKNCFSEIMTMCCLEYELGAPKILSAYEINRSGKYKSTGIHLRKQDGIISLVCGVSALEPDLPSAIHRIVSQADSIVDNQNSELKIIHSSLNYLHLDKNEEDQLLNSILPHPARQERQIQGPEFGGVICYSGPDKKGDKSEFIEKMILDIQDTQDLLYQQIKDLQLEKYRFSIYFIPFNDVLEEAALVDE